MGTVLGDVRRGSAMEERDLRRAGRHVGGDDGSQRGPAQPERPGRRVQRHGGRRSGRRRGAGYREGGHGRG